MSREIGVISLFSGVGGFDLGLERAGMTTIFQCEIDRHCLGVLERWWPEVCRWDDISTLTGAYILDRLGGVAPDVVAWGSPCQDLSVAGRRRGLEGERSGLFYEGMRIIREIREATNGRYPRISIWENVAGALSSSAGADFGQVLYEMDEAGACFSEWRLLDAQFFGVPQRRRRVFLISVFDPAAAERSPSPLLSDSPSVRGNTSQGSAQREASPRSAASGVGESDRLPILIDRAAFNQGINAQYDTHISDHPVSPSLVAKGPHAVATFSFPAFFGSLSQITEEMTNPISVKAGPPAVATFSKAHRAQSETDHESWVEADTAPTLNSFDVGDARATVAVAYSIREDAKADTFSATELDRANALNALRPSPQSHHAQMFIAEHEAAVRRLTPVECERLMGWPDGWTEQRADGSPQADTQRYKQCGNGVASPVAEWIGRIVVDLLEPGT